MTFKSVQQNCNCTKVIPLFKIKIFCLKKQFSQTVWAKFI